MMSNFLKNISIFSSKLGDSGGDAPSEDTIKKTGWEVGQLVCGWIFTVGAIALLIASIFTAIMWFQNMEDKSKKKKFIGCIAGFIFCVIVGPAFLAGLFSG